MPEGRRRGPQPFSLARVSCGAGRPSALSSGDALFAVRCRRPLMVGIKGAISEFYLADLAAKTKRGQAGRVKAGRIPGGRCYGYDVVRDGSEERGRRQSTKRRRLSYGGFSPNTYAGVPDQDCEDAQCRGRTRPPWRFLERFGVAGFSKASQWPVEQ